MERRPGSSPWSWRPMLRFAVGSGLVVWALVAVRTAERPALAALLAVTATAGLLSKPRYPLVVLGLALGALPLTAWLAGFSGADDPFIMALVWASYGVGRHAALRRQPWAAAGALAFISLNVVGDLGFPSVVVLPGLFSAGPWLAGLTIQRLQERSDAAVQLARDAALTGSRDVRRATAEERLRLARELHDVAAHQLTAVSLQAQVLRDRMAGGDALRSADLDTISRSAQAALTEIRRVVGVLRAPGEPPQRAPLPGIDDLPALVATSLAAGQLVALRVEGAPRPLTDGVSLALYRIAQEALTNARRHGASSATTLVLSWGPTSVTLRAENAMRSLVRRVTPGNGILGMQERIELYGGHLRAGPGEAGAWAVEATIPVGT